MEESRNNAYNTGFLKVVATPYRWVKFVYLIILITLLSAAIINALCMKFIWNSPYLDMLTLAHQELSNSRPIAAHIVNVLDWMLLKVFKLSDFYNQLITVPVGEPLTYKKFNLFGGTDAWIVLNQFIESFRASILLACIRISYVVEILPVAIIFYVVCIHDGLVERKIRTWCGGRESDFIYHRAKYINYYILVIVLSIYPVLPIDIKKEWLFISVFLMGCTLFAQSWYYKKYI